ncbi:MAG: aminotransferase class III-fold pyridoxal phosphate-dependent enzyme [Deinococcales bacterium]
MQKTIEVVKPPADSNDDNFNAYGRYLKPKIDLLLEAAGLDKSYHRAEGNYLFYRENQLEHKVVDFLGGYGTSLFGHNHPELLQVAMQCLEQKRPFAAQASIRRAAGHLAKRLALWLKDICGQDYMVTLANSGAEAVEAAIKHGGLEHQQTLQTILNTQRQALQTLKSQTNYLPKSFYEQAAEMLNVLEISDLASLEYHLLRHNENIFAEQVFLAVKGSFHGKSSGALKLTYNKAFRAPWQHLGISSVFVRLNDETHLTEIFKAHEKPYLAIDLENLSLSLKPYSSIVAALIEPIQGEGGIHELRPSFAQKLARLCQDAAIPLIIDEIQSGMGRTGQFLASEALGITGDYYLFSKALGGNLAKIAALMVKKERYIEEFGYLHTSTFAEDDISSLIALKAIELLEQGLLNKIQQRGHDLKQALEALVKAYPQIFKEVRGRGLMLGLEWLPQPESLSNFIRLLSEQKLLSYVICGYLLNVHHIRVAPTLSAEMVMRLEPSAYIHQGDIDRLIQGLEDVAQKLESHDSCSLVSYLVGLTPHKIVPKTTSVAAKKLIQRLQQKPALKKVACIGHFMELSDLVHWDPYLNPLTDEASGILLEKTQKALGPFMVDKHQIRSVNGEAVELYLIGVPYTAQNLIDRIRQGKLKEASQIIQQAHDLALTTGASQIGFTGYSSIATNNCTAIGPSSAGLTSGNSLTAALSLEALQQTMKTLGIEEAKACLGVVGAVGNIGRILAELAALNIPKLILIGREGSQRRLYQVADAIYSQAWQQTQQGSRDGLSLRLAQESLEIPKDVKAVGTYLREIFAERYQAEAPIYISTQMGDLIHCNVIISATNVPQTIIFPEHLSAQPVAICDVSVPPDVDNRVLEHCPQAKVIKGGIVKLPLGQHLDIPGMPLAQGQLYACMAETILLGLAGIGENFSYGSLEKHKVQQIRQLSKDHGFEVVAKAADGLSISL